MPVAESDLSNQSRFLALPVELRSRILAQLLAADNNRHNDGDGSTHHYTFHVAIIRVNRQLHDEAAEVFRRCNTFVQISTLWEEAESHIADKGMVPIIARGDHALTFHPIHATVSVDVPPHELESPIHTPVKSHIVICAQDLHLFCKFWYYSDLSHRELNSHLLVTIHVQNLHAPDPSTLLPRAAQHLLLDPFILVKNLRAITITGALDDAVVADFRKRNAEPHTPPESCLEACSRFKDAGNAHMKHRDFAAAIKAYEDAFHAMHIPVHGRRRHVWAEAFFERRLVGGTFDGQNGSMVRMEMRIRLVANMVQAYLELPDVETAVFWGDRSIRMMREQMGEFAERPPPGFPAAQAWGKVYYRTGRGMQLLGKQDEARDLFRVAANWLPDDPSVRQARAETALKLG